MLTLISLVVLGVLFGVLACALYFNYRIAPLWRTETEVWKNKLQATSESQAQIAQFLSDLSARTTNHFEMALADAQRSADAARALKSQLDEFCGAYVRESQWLHLQEEALPSRLREHSAALTEALSESLQEASFVVTALKDEVQKASLSHTREVSLVHEGLAALDLPKVQGSIAQARIELGTLISRLHADVATTRVSLAEDVARAVGKAVAAILAERGEDRLGLLLRIRTEAIAFAEQMRHHMEVKRSGAKWDFRDKFDAALAHAQKLNLTFKANFEDEDLRRAIEAGLGLARVANQTQGVLPQKDEEAA